MRVITILNQGTANDSTDRKGTSNGCELVVSKLATLMAGAEKVDWLLNEGAGTEGLKKQGVETSGLAGVVAGKGVEGNVKRAVDMVKLQKQSVSNAGGFMVNLVGHSRGSITCYKIARALRDDTATAAIPVNIFAIDPVPGNMGVMNHKNWRDIALGSNLRNSFLVLAESDRRLPFRPYVDALYSMGMPDHKFDTIPGTHGGINELEGSEKEAASIVLSRALEFLRDNNSQLKTREAESWILDEGETLAEYAKLMQRIKKYKKHGKTAMMWAIGALRMEDRHVMVHGPKEEFGKGAKGGWAGVGTAESQSWARGGFHGLKMEKAVGKMLGEEAHSSRPHRFFANLQHQTLFCEKYGCLGDTVKEIERGGGEREKQQKRVAACLPQFAAMSQPEKEYYGGWLAKKGLTPP
ncbi:MAG: hypothetical protein K2W96_16605 [Gemmataceae bacterium]|nr:hypothetical protein [Gemmataceae bacterium]